MILIVRRSAMQPEGNTTTCSCQRQLLPVKENRAHNSNATLSDNELSARRKMSCF
jgi:hypothetical protein